MNRRLALRLLALLAVLGLIAAACGSGDDTTDDADADADDAADEADADDDTADDAADEATDRTTDETADNDDPDGAADEATEDAADDGDEAPELGYTVRQVPAGYATIQAAVDAAESGDLILIAEGTYNEAIVVETDNLVLRGIDRNTVILDGENLESSENGIKIFSHGVAVENLTIRNYTRNGLFWTGSYADDFFVDGYRASYVTVHNIGVYGMYAFNAINGQFDHTYAGATDDSAYYVGQCLDCNALVYMVEAENSQLGYSGTNSSGTIIANSWFHDNMAGVIPNSQDGEELAPNRDTVIIGNLIENNNNAAVPSRSSGYRLALGSGVVLAGTTRAIVERNTIIGNERFGVVVIDWVSAALGGETDYFATDNIVRNNLIEGSIQETDLLLGILDVSGGGQGNCFIDNQYGSSIPADIEVSLPCEGDATTELESIEALLDRFNIAPFEPVSYIDIPWPEYDFDNMPGDPATDPPAPATDVPMAIDLDAIVAPEPS